MSEHAINVRLDVLLLIGFPLGIALAMLAVERILDAVLTFLRDWC